MTIEVRYFKAGQPVKSRPALTMFDARRTAKGGAPREADQVVILAVRDDGSKIEIETRRLDL